MPKRGMFHLYYFWYLLLVFVIVIAFFFLKTEPAITGGAVYEEIFLENNWSFADPDDYTYNRSLIEIANNEARLVSTMVTVYWNTTLETEFNLISALYNPTAETDKVNELDDKVYNLHPNKLFEVFFAVDLDNGDLISFYLEGENEGIIYLCARATFCDSNNYGSIDYSGEEGWYNLTVSGLNSPAKVFNFRPSADLKLNYVTSTKGNLVQALSDPKDKINKVNILDNNWFELDKDKLFNIIFGQQIDNGNIVSLYLRGGSASEIYFCDYGESCSSPGYGAITYDGNKGWYNLTINVLSGSSDSFNLDPDHVKIDYIKAVRIEIEEHSATNITYPSLAELQTADFQPSGLLSWNIFFREEQLDGQNISYEYSTDSGISWNDVPGDGDLSFVDAGSGKIRFKAVLFSNKISTPILTKLSLGYVTRTCTENWTKYVSDCLINDTQLKYYSDENNCGTINDRPEDNGNYINCDYCSENLTGPYYTSCAADDTRTKYYADQNYFSCCAVTGLASDCSIIYNSAYMNMTESCDYCLPNWVEVNDSCSPSNNLTSWFNDTNNCYFLTNLSFDNVPPAGIFYNCTYQAAAPEAASGGQSGGGGGSGGGGRGGRTLQVMSEELPASEATGTPLETKIKTLPETNAGFPSEIICDYILEVSLPKQISFVKNDTFHSEIVNKGNCNIQKLNFYLSPNLEDLVSLPAASLENVKEGDTADLVIIRKSKNKKKSWLDFLTASAVSRFTSFETTAGIITVEALADQEPVFREELPLDVEMEVEGAAINKAGIIFWGIGLLVLTVLIAFLKRKKIKKKIKKKKSK